MVLWGYRSVLSFSVLFFFCVEKQMKQFQANIAAVGGKATNSTAKKQSLVYEENVLQMLNSVIVPYFPSSVDHQPNLFSPEERAVEVLASHVVSTKRPLSINSLHTMDYGLDVMTRCQKEGKTLLGSFGKGGLCTDCEEIVCF
jgi:hypothetical protein